MLNRRRLLASAGFAVAGLALLPGVRAAFAAAGGGGLDAAAFGVAPGAGDQSRAFARMLERAAEIDAAVFLPPGRYVVSSLMLPRRVRLAGVPGASRIVHGGDGHFLLAEGGSHIELTGLILDGAQRPLGGRVEGALHMRAVAHVIVDNCAVTGSTKYGIALERTGGRIERSRITGAAEAGLWSVDAAGLAVTGNNVADCANGGILIHRSAVGADGTLVTGNRVERIAAAHGGTGQFGNGINVFRAGNVVIGGNQVADCAFSAIRSNSGSNVQINGNTCLRSGETALYSEFAFEGAAISNNIVDGAANGISVVNANEGGRLAVVAGNIVRNLRTEGPYPADSPGFGVGITVEADTAVTGNVVDKAPRYGLHLGWGPYLRNVVATGNVIRDTGEGIAVSVVEGAGQVVITDNVIEGARHGAIVGHRWAEAVTGDLAVEKPAMPGFVIERNQTKFQP